MTGLLIAGRSVAVPGVRVISPGEEPWCRLAPDDYRPRRTSWVRQLIIHTTGGRWPQPVLPGAGPRGHAQQIAEMWSGADRDGGERVHSGAQLIVDFDGSVACLCDLANYAAYHAEMSNDWSVGIEMSTMPTGSIYYATLDATVKLAAVICDAIGIPFQIHGGLYANEPLPRMERVEVLPGGARKRTQLGGPDCVGIFGHRNNTSNRGRGDPGDAVYAALIAAGAEPLDFASGEDLRAGAARQTWLVAHGAKIPIDGKVGPQSLAAARRLGFSRWSQVPKA